MAEQEYEELQEHTIRQRGMVIEYDARGRQISIRIPNPFIIDELLSRGIIDREYSTGMRAVRRHAEGIPPPGRHDQDGHNLPVGQRWSPAGQVPLIADNDYLIVLRDMRHECSSAR